MAKDLTSIFTKELRAIDERARRIAIHYRHERVDLAHYLLAFIEDPGQGIRDLSTGKDPGLSATETRLRAFLEGLPRSKVGKTGDRDVKYTRRLEAIVDAARLATNRSGAVRISPSSLFLALASEDFYSEAERGAVGERLLSPADLTPSPIEQIVTRGGNSGF